MSYEQAIKYLYNLQPIGIKFGLNNTLSLLAHFHNPHQKIKTIHVAGTNGKGSICSMLSSILQSAGYKVGLYTSPHLIDFTERISINGNPIPQSEVASLTEKIRYAINDGDFKANHPTFFEVVTVMALIYFYEQYLDLAIMEVGMGGRLDATNVIQPLMGIISTIALDHQQYLGKSLGHIAQEKAGIIKRGMPVIIGDCHPEILQIISYTCQKMGATLIQAPPLSNAHILHQDLSCQKFEVLCPKESPKQYSISLLGHHQIQNTLTTLTAAKKLNDLLPRQISHAQICKGLTSARWPGRIEVYPGSPLIIIDGAHNPAAAHSLSRFIKELKFLHLTLVIGVMKDKEIDKICQDLVPLAFRIILTRPNIARAALPRDILHILHSQSLLPNSVKVSMVDSIPEAITLAKTQSGLKDIICITGSLYTAGEAKVVLDER